MSTTTNATGQRTSSNLTKVMSSPKLRFTSSLALQDVRSCMNPSPVRSLHALHSAATTLATLVSSFTITPTRDGGSCVISPHLHLHHATVVDTEFSFSRHSFLCFVARQQVIMDPGNITTGRSFFGDDLPPMGTVIDDTWIIQSNHGPFNRSEAPSDVGTCKPETCKTLDHWGQRFTAAMRDAARDLRRTNSTGKLKKLGIGAGSVAVSFRFHMYVMFCI